MSHSYLAPSASHTWAYCTAQPRFLESLNLPPEPHSEAAQEGTNAHEVFASHLLDPSAKRYRTVEEKQHLPVAFDWVETVLFIYDNPEFFVETKVDPAEFVGTKHCAGTADVIIPIDFGPLFVADLKFGRVVVDVVDNTQLLLYALGALSHFESLGYVFTHIVMAVLQPRAYHPDGVIREWRVSREELLGWADFLKTRARDALGGNGIFRVDPDKQCRYCRAAGVCRPLAEYELKHIRTTFTEVVDLDAEFKDTSNLSTRELAGLLDSFSGIKKWIENVEDLALELIDSNVAIPFWGKRPKRAIRKWKPEPDELEMYFTEEELYEQKLRTPAQVEIAIGKKLPEMFVKRESSGYNLVPTDIDETNETNSFDEVDDG